MKQSFDKGKIIKISMFEPVQINDFLYSSDVYEAYDILYKNRPAGLKFIKDNRFFGWNNSEEKHILECRIRKFISDTENAQNIYQVQIKSPLHIANVEDNALIINENVPEDYYLLADYIKGKAYIKNEETKSVCFSSKAAIIQAAWNIVGLYKLLLKNELIYAWDLTQSLYIHCQSGRIIFFDIYGLGVMGHKIDQSIDISFASAPEIILNKQDSNSVETDYWTLAVYLHGLFYHTVEPLRGYDTLNKIFYDKKEELIWMAENGRYILNQDEIPSLVYGVHGVTMKYLQVFPDFLLEAFDQCFQNGKEDPKKRLDINEWLNVINRLKNEYIQCRCGVMDFAQNYQQEHNRCRCKKCGRIYYVFESDYNRIYLAEGSNIYQNQIDISDPEKKECIGAVVENKQVKGRFGVKNLSQISWLGTFPNGEEKEIAPGKGIIIWKNLKIDFGNGCVWKIKGDET